MPDVFEGLNKLQGAIGSRSASAARARPGAETDPRAADFVPVPDQPAPDFKSGWRGFLDSLEAELGARLFVGQAVALLRRDDRLVRLCAVWPSVAPPLDWPASDLPPDTRDAWATLWAPLWQGPQGQMTVELLSGSTGMSVEQTLAAVRVGMGMKLLFPDGRVHPGVRSFLEAEADAIGRAATMVPASVA